MIQGTVCDYYFDHYGKFLSQGFFVEIGALDGSNQNSTKILENAGWEGVCVEPISENIRKLKKNRKCRIIEGAVWIETGNVEFADVGIRGWTGIAETHQEFHREKYKDSVVKFSVPCFTFDSLDLPNRINYLQIDTEGSELKILKTVDMKKYQIDFICIEDNLGLVGDTTYHMFMNSQNYELVHQIAQDKLYKKL